MGWALEGTTPEFEMQCNIIKSNKIQKCIEEKGIPTNNLEVMKSTCYIERITEVPGINMGNMETFVFNEVPQFFSYTKWVNTNLAFIIQTIH